MLINMGLSAALLEGSLQLTLRWRPRDENVVADNLTNHVTTDVEETAKVMIQWDDLDLALVYKLWESRASTHHRKDKTPW